MPLTRAEGCLWAETVLVAVVGPVRALVSCRQRALHARALYCDLERQVRCLAGMLHPTINLDNPEDEVDMSIIVAGEKMEHNVDVALTNSFGFGGHNSSIIFSKYHE